MIDFEKALGWIRDDERRVLRRLASETSPDSVMINIGIEYGASIACLRAGNRRATIIGIDVDLSKLVPEVYQACEPLLINEDSSSQKCRDAVTSLIKMKADGVGLVFVDGSHTFEGVMMDTWYAGLLSSRGIIVFHDCFDYDHPETGLPNPNSPDVNIAVQEWFLMSDGWIEMPRSGTMRIFRKE